MSNFFEDRPENMVLRTVFFPPALDDRLRVIAHRSKISKGDLIRQLIDAGLSVSLDRSGLALAANMNAKRQAKDIKPTANNARGKTTANSKASKTISRVRNSKVVTKK